MKILVTGFDPFDREKINPAYEAVKLLPDSICGAEIIKLEIPTVFARCAEAVEQAVERHNPDIVLCVGQAGGRSCISVEKVAINFAEARIPDNEGNQPLDKAIVPDGPAAYFSTLPVKAMVENVRSHGIPANLSYSAGTFVCNDVMYRLLHLAATKYHHIKGGFIHVPYTLEQAVSKPDGTPAWDERAIAKGLEYAIEAVVKKTESSNTAMGTTH
ncbi:MAG: pyroglutamyl-peptidase I [Oscillospiraceae bacterium]|nr:pyroglutamyl-peptidase I [Oscillospiraceae bacterium]